MTSEMPFHHDDLTSAMNVHQAHTLALASSGAVFGCSCGSTLSTRTAFVRHQMEASLRALVAAGWKSPQMIKAEEQDKQPGRPRRVRRERTGERVVFRDPYASIKEMVIEALATKYPEPPDGTRIEFQEHGSPGGDLIAIYRDDASSAEAGWPTGDGGKVWCEYGRSVPITWTEVLEDPRLAAAISGRYLIVKPEPKRVIRVFAAASTQQIIPNDVNTVRDKDGTVWVRVMAGKPAASDTWKVPKVFTYPYVNQEALLRNYGPVTEVLS